MLKKIGNIKKRMARSALFKIKYKFGIAKEGKDFFNCRTHEFCNNCTYSHKPCNKYFE